MTEIIITSLITLSAIGFAIYLIAVLRKIIKDVENELSDKFTNTKTQKKMDEQKFFLFLAHLTLMKENYDEVKKYIIESEVEALQSYRDYAENDIAKKYLHSKKLQKKHIEKLNTEIKQRITGIRKDYNILSKVSGEVIHGLSKTNGTILPEVIKEMREHGLNIRKPIKDE